MCASMFACANETPVPQHGRAHETVPATLLLVDRLDDEGGLVARAFSADTTPAAFFRGDTAFVTVQLALAYLDAGARAQLMNGVLRIENTDAAIPAELRDTVVFVPLQPLARQFRAYARIEQTPGGMVTLWRHDVLCGYARGADRRAEVFIAAAEQELLRTCDPPIHASVRRYTAVRPDERWAASITFGSPLDSARAAALLASYNAAPFAAYGGIAGHQLVARSSPDSASLRVLGQLRDNAVETLQRTLCGLPGALERRGGAGAHRGRAAGEDAYHAERHMLAAVLAAERELPRVRAGATIVYGLDVLASAADLQRLTGDGRVRQLHAATRVDEEWVLPGAATEGIPGVTAPPEIARLDSAALFERLRAEAARAAAACSS